MSRGFDKLFISLPCSAPHHRSRSINHAFHEEILEFLIFILEGALHEDGNGFLLTGCVHLQQLLEHIWDAAGDYVNDNTLTVYIKRLRDKLEDDPQNPSLIKTVRNIGYKLGE